MDEMELSPSISANMVQNGFCEPNHSISNGYSISPSSDISGGPPSPFSPSLISTRDNHSIADLELDRCNMHPALVSSDATPLQESHIVQLSAIEHCMPRAYIRVCLAYRLPMGIDLSEVIGRLNRYARKLVDAKPYLAGFVVPAPDAHSRVGLSEIRFTDEDFLRFPSIEVHRFTRDEVPYSYEELDRKGLPPSVIRPELVSALPEGTDNSMAPAFRMQANIVDGGLIVSVYLHHCIADGTGLSLLLTGAILHDEFAFHRHLNTNGLPSPSLNMRLAAFANRSTIIRQNLSWSEHNQISDRNVQHGTRAGVVSPVKKANSSGRGCLVALSRESLDRLTKSLQAHVPGCFMTSNDALQALLWHHMTKSRRASLKDSSVTHAKLLVPVNIRSKLKEPLPDAYFGAAVDFATAELSLAELAGFDGTRHVVTLTKAALTIRHAISNVNEAYIRQAIALAQLRDPDIDVRDLMASNMNRTEGADMYITSWERLGLYDVTLDLDLGRPDWVRKPWSRDQGSCIIMPSDDRKPYLEVLVQMAAPDVERLLRDDVFMSHVVRTID